jgi:hypothetical protein
MEGSVNDKEKKSNDSWGCLALIIGLIVYSLLTGGVEDKTEKSKRLGGADVEYGDPVRGGDKVIYDDDITQDDLDAYDAYLDDLHDSYGEQARNELDYPEYESWEPSTQETYSGACDSSYSSVCIPIVNYDLDCEDISYRGFAVGPADPHWFDADNDGIGCEDIQ